MTDVWFSQRQVTLLILQRSSEVSSWGYFFFSVTDWCMFRLLGHFALPDV